MLRSLIIAAGLAVISAGAAVAGSLSANPPTETTVCLDVNGQSLPAVCRVPGSRIDKREDICICPQGQKVEAPVCAKGERPPAETIAYDKARKQAGRDGSLIGDTYEGRAMCVAERRG